MKDKLKIMKGAHAAKRTHGSSTSRLGSASATASDTPVADRVRNAALATILAAGIVGAPYVTAVSAGATDESAESDKNGSNANEIKNKADSASMFKDETVYVFKKADGQNKNITVSDWLKNGDSDKTLSDVSNLKNIQNTEGNQAYTTGSKNQLTWAADGNDIYYQGSTTKKLPVDVKVTYWLNGKKVTPDEISGKSGKVKIRYDYTNNSKVTENGYSVYTPFVAMTAVILNNDNFKNVKITNAKMVNDGDRTTVVGYALPGMSDSLDMKDADLNIPEYVEITADATDFTLSSSATYVTSDLFNGVDTDKMDTSQIGDKLNEMQDAMEQLMDGSNSLLDGLNKLAAGSDTLATGLKAAKTGTKQLSNGSGQVLSGLQQLRNGTSTSTGLIDAVNSIGTKSDTAKDGTLLGGTNAIGGSLNTLDSSLKSSLTQAKNGANQLTAGAKSAKAGATQLKTGSKQLQDGLSALKAQFDQGVGVPNDPNTLLGGSAALSAGIGKLGTELSDSLTKAKNGADQLASGASSAKAGAEKLSSGATGLIQGLTQLESKVDAGIGASDDTSSSTLLGGANALSAGLTQLQTSADSGLESLEKQLKGASSSLKQISSGIDSYGKAANSALSDAQTQAGNIKDTEASDNSAQVNSDAEALNNSIDANKNLTDDEKASLKKQVAAMQQDGTVTSKATDNSAAVTQIQTDIKTAEGAIEKVVGTGGLTSQIDTVASGLSQGADTVASQKTQLDSGIEKLKTGSNNLAKGLQSLKSSIDSAIGAAGDSYTAQVAGGSNPTLLGIANDLSGGLSGNGGLISGLTALSTGASTLSESIGASTASDSTLNKGLNQLQTGSNKLNSGISTLKSGVDGGLGDKDTSGTLINGAAQLNAGSGALATGLGKLEAGAATLGSSIGTSLQKNSTLNKGLKALKSGVKQVSDGLYSMKYGGKMADGRTSSGLQGAVDALGNKTTKNTLIYGANALSGGLASLLSASGTAADGAATLATNMRKAASGSAELSDGLKKFDDQAVKKLLNYYNDNLSGLTDRVDALVSAGKDYKNYSGISKDMDGQVKFIMEMDGINDSDDNGNSDSNSDSSDNGGTNDSGQNSSSTVAAVTESSDSNNN